MYFLLLIIGYSFITYNAEIKYDNLNLKKQNTDEMRLSFID